MARIDPYAIYSLWLREMIRFFRLKSRVVGSLAPPFFFLAILGMGFRSTMVVPEGVNYIDFLAPGIIGMTLLFSATFGGLSMLWDREFGFLREIMVAPVSRLSIVLGRTAGGVTTAVMQGVIILVPGILMGLKITGLGGFSPISGIHGPDSHHLQQLGPGLRIQDEGHVRLQPDNELHGLPRLPLIGGAISHREPTSLAQDPILPGSYDLWRGRPPGVSGGGERLPPRAGPGGAGGLLRRIPGPGRLPIRDQRRGMMGAVHTTVQILKYHFIARHVQYSD